MRMITSYISDERMKEITKKTKKPSRRRTSMKTIAAIFTVVVVYNVLVVQYLVNCIA